jgi:tetratricopeptide (TPR) repeat protein
VKEVVKNLNTVQKFLAKDEMEQAYNIIHSTLTILYNTFLLSAAVLKERRKLQFQIYLAKIVANFEFLAAICHTDMNELTQALEHFTQSAIHSTIAGNPNNVVISNYLKSLSFIHNNQYEEALRHFEMTRLLSEHYKIPRYSVMGLGGQAITKFLMGDVEQANLVMNEVNKLIEEDEQESLLVMNEFGDNFYMLGRPDVALHLYNEALEIAISLKRANIADSIFSKMKRSYYANGSYDSAPLVSQLHKLLDLAYNLKNEDEVALYKQRIAQLADIKERINEPLPFDIKGKWVSGNRLPAPLKGWMDLLHIAREEKQLKGDKNIQFTNFFCYKPEIGYLVIQIPERAPVRFERVPEAYKLSLKNNEERYSIINASDAEKEKYSIRLIIITKAMDNVTLRRVTPQVLGKFLEI